MQLSKQRATSSFFLGGGHFLFVTLRFVMPTPTCVTRFSLCNSACCVVSCWFPSSKSKVVAVRREKVVDGRD